MDFIKGIFNAVIHSAFIEYYVAATVVILFVVFVKYGHNKYVSLLAYPFAGFYFIGESIVNVFKKLQLTILRNRLINGSRWEVMFYFIITGILGFVAAFMAKYLGILAVTAPPFLILGFIFSGISKYLNFIILPEIIQHGNEKLTSFTIYNKVSAWIIKQWNKFKTTKLYERVVKIKNSFKANFVKAKDNFKAKILAVPGAVDFFNRLKESKGVFSKFLNAIKENLRKIREKGFWKSLKDKWNEVKVIKVNVFSDESMSSLDEMYSKITTGNERVTDYDMKKLIIELQKEALAAKK